MQVIASKVLVIFLYIAVGFVANKLRVLGTEAVDHLISLVLNITTPCLLIYSICGQTISANTFSNTVIIILLSLAMFALFGAISVKISRLFTKKSVEQQNVLSVAMVTSNSGFMGFPIARSVFGHVVLYYSVIQNIACNLYIFTGCMIQLSLGGKKESGARKTINKETIIKPFKNVVTIVSICSILVLFAGIRIPNPVMDFLATIGNATVPISMIIIGIQLGDCKFRELITDKELIISSLVCLILEPALSILIVYFMPLSKIIKLTIALSFTYPSAVLSVALAAGEHKDTKLMSEAVAMSTMLSMLTLPVWIMIISHLF
nr:AEC family transporter [uncultured Mogibacterium sp.]